MPHTRLTTAGIGPQLTNSPENAGEPGKLPSNLVDLQTDILPKGVPTQELCVGETADSPVEAQSQGTRGLSLPDRNLAEQPFEIIEVAVSPIFEKFLTLLS